MTMVARGFSLQMAEADRLGQVDPTADDRVTVQAESDRRHVGLTCRRRRGQSRQSLRAQVLDFEVGEHTHRDPLLTHAASPTREDSEERSSMG